MERFEDVSVLAAVDESPPPPRVPRRARRAFVAGVATIVATGALAGAAVGLASEKQEPAAPAASQSGGWMKLTSGGGHPCHHGDRPRPSRSSSLSY
jgi:hypothetical protein